MIKRIKKEKQDRKESHTCTLCYVYVDDIIYWLTFILNVLLFWKLSYKLQIDWRTGQNSRALFRGEKYQNTTTKKFITTVRLLQRFISLAELPHCFKNICLKNNKMWIMFRYIIKKILKWNWRCFLLFLKA